MTLKKSKKGPCSICKTNANYQLNMGYHGYDGYCHWICYVYHPWIDVSKYKEPENTNAIAIAIAMQSQSQSQSQSQTQKQTQTQAQTKKTQISIDSIKEECKTEIKTTQSVSKVNPARSIHYHNDFNLNDPWQARVAASSP